MLRKMSVGLAVAAIAVGFSQAANAINITVKNNCSSSITVYVGGASWTGLGSGASATYGAANGWNGRIQDNMTVGASLSEWNLDASGTDWYDISYVDGYNDMMGIAVSNSSCAQPNCSSKPSCPTVTNGSICDSPCTAYNTAQYCCSGADDTSAACDEAGWPAPGSTYVNDIHSSCSGEYAYAYDDNIGLHTCATGPSYTVTFCTSGGSGGGGGTLGNGVYPISPENAPGMVMDDTGGNTANGTKIELWQSNGGSNQAWNWANVSGSGYNAAVLGPYCLDNDNGTNTGCVLWSCNGNNNQLWNASRNSDGSYQFTVAATGQCLDDFGGGTSNGTTIGTWGCNGGSNQKWNIE